VEILSPSTALSDRHTKYEYYQQQGVPNYLIVDVEQKKTEIYALAEGAYQLQDGGSEYQFNLSRDCSITPQLNAVFD
jgi:Uma2 family endonuclease